MFLKNSFVCLDVETANADYSSICQIGLVEFSEGEEVDSWSTLINPRTFFDPFNTSIHGIDEEDVASCPTFQEAFDSIIAKLYSRIVVHHGHFDKTAFKRCYDLFDLEPIQCDWLDNTKIVRRTWQQFSQRGYGLANLAHEFDIPFDHHNALQDARTAGKITNKAILKSGKSIEDWLMSIDSPIAKDTSSQPLVPARVNRAGDETGSFFGESIVFTGTLRVPKTTAADMAKKLGFNVTSTVTKSTTYLCVGIQDLSKLAGYTKSSKHRQVEELIKKGNQIHILSEEAFWILVNENVIT